MSKKLSRHPHTLLSCESHEDCIYCVDENLEECCKYCAKGYGGNDLCYFKKSPDYVVSDIPRVVIGKNRTVTIEDYHNMPICRFHNGPFHNKLANAELFAQAPNLVDAIKQALATLKDEEMSPADRIEDAIIDLQDALDEVAK